KWLAATSTAGTSDRLAAAKATFSTESAEIGHRTPTPQAISRPTNPDRAYRLSRRSYQENPHALGHAT
ncbi:hypothetical protein N0762_23800, partial [Pseudomonas aeruginosa]|nr:hypothetical protein [Pseudomonas aeruginosa]